METQESRNLVGYVDDFNSNVKSETFSDRLFERFIEFIDATPKTILTYKISIRQFFKWIKQNGIIDPIRNDIKKYRDDLESSGLKPSTVKNYMVAVKQFFKWTSNEKLYSNIAQNIKVSKTDDSRGYNKDPLTTDQVAILLETIETNTLSGLRDYVLLLMALGNSEVLYVQGKGRREKKSL